MTFMLRVSTFTSLPLFLLISFALHATEAKENWTVVNYVQVEEERILNAVVEAVHQATISSQTTGRVVKINADVDDTVNKGDILIQFRNKEQKAALNVAQAAFEEAEAEYKRTQDIYNKKTGRKDCNG